nr:hypothetical protein [Lichenibacterium ramalinae]
MHGSLDVGVGETPGSREAEVLGAAWRGLHLVCPEIEVPDAELAGLGREAQAFLAPLLSLGASGHLRGECHVVALQSRQTVPFGRDVDLAGEEVAQGAVGTVDRCRQEPIPEARAVSTRVLDLDLDGLGNGYGGPDAGHRVGIRVGALQETAVPTEDLRTRVAGQPAEGVVGEDDRVIGQAWVRYHHGHACGLDRGEERVFAEVRAGNLGGDVIRCRR